MSPVMLSSLGMAVGFAALVLGIAQLACEHKDAPMLPRVTTGVMALLAAWTLFDCWDAWAGIGKRTDPKAVVFCAVLAVSWGYRRLHGLMTHQPGKPAPEMKPEDLT